MKLSSALRFVSVLTCILYVFGMVGLDSIHRIGHSHDHAEHHSEELESDACHRAIFHGDLSLGCEHKAHVHETNVDCDLCDVITNRADQLSPEVNQVFVYSINSGYDIDFQSTLPSNFWKANRDRGPPSV